MKATIRAWTGTEFVDREVDALECGVPGLFIHRSLDGDGLMLTHAASGLAAACFPGDVFWCAEALGELGDWSGAPDKELLLKAKKVIEAYDTLPGPSPVPQAAKETEWARSGVPSLAPEPRTPTVRGHLSAVHGVSSGG